MASYFEVCLFEGAVNEIINTNEMNTKEKPKTKRKIVDSEE